MLKGATTPATEDKMLRSRRRRTRRRGGFAHPRWRDMLARVAARAARDNVALVAAGLAFNAMFALFPILIVLLSLYGMFASPEQVSRELRPFLALLPGDAARLILQQLRYIASRPRAALGIGAVVSMTVTLWSSIQGVLALTTAANIAYHAREQRGYVRLAALALVLTLGGILGFAFMVALTIAAPLALEGVRLGPLARDVALAVRWVLLISFSLLALGVVYHFGPCRPKTRWRWVTWGSVAASALWILGSVVFASYVTNFASYGQIYGTLGGAMVLLMWFYLGSFAILIGAEINAEWEQRPAQDARTGPPGPPGEHEAERTLSPARSESPRSANPSSGH